MKYTIINKAQQSLGKMVFIIAMVKENTGATKTIRCPNVN